MHFTGHLLSFFFNNNHSSHALLHTNNNDETNNTNNNEQLNLINSINQQLEQHQQRQQQSHTADNYNYPTPASNALINEKLNQNYDSSSPTIIRDRCIPNMQNGSSGINIPSIDRYFPENGNKPTAKIKKESENMNPSKDILQQQQSLASNMGQNNEGYNKMMLPPPPRFAQFNTAPSSSMNQMAHLEWLKTMNELAAKQSSAPVATTTSPLIAPISMPPQLPQQQMQTASFATNTMQQPQSMLLPATNINYNNLPQTTPTTLPQTTPTVLPQKTSISNNTKNESEERRLRRLARNRESARQSRRRKKELLETLEKKANDKHKMLEDERKNQINSMFPDLQSVRHKNIQTLHSSMGNIQKRDEDALYHSITQQQDNVIKEITMHQYERLKSLVLPISSQYILWLLHSNPLTFFQIAKELAIKENNLMNSTRISSKQIGEKHSKTQNDNYECDIDNLKLFWPYFCNEMSISVDQEERILSLHRNVQKQVEREELEQIRKTQYVVYYLKQIMLQKSKQRNDLSNILTKEQYIRYLKWRLDSKSKCNDIIEKMSNGDGDMDKISSSSTNDRLQQKDGDSKSLDELCRRLNEALNVSANNNGDEADENVYF